MFISVKASRAGFYLPRKKLVPTQTFGGDS